MVSTLGREDYKYHQLLDLPAGFSRCMLNTKKHSSICDHENPDIQHLSTWDLGSSNCGTGLGKYMSTECRDP